MKCTVFFILVLVIIFIVVLIILTFLFRLSIILTTIKYGSVRFNIFNRTTSTTTTSSWLGASRARIEPSSSNVEVLQFKLLYSRLESSVVLSQLYKLSVDSINGEISLLSWRALKRSIHVELAILSVALSEDALDIIRD